MEDVKCECCDAKAKFNIKVAKGDDGLGGNRLYLPNQSAREARNYRDVIEKLWLCHPCMRFVEDNFRASVNYLKSENGSMFREK